VAEKTKKLSERLREVMDAWLDALESLLSPRPALVPVRVRRSRPPMKRRR